jgi:hypothetical protein
LQIIKDQALELGMVWNPQIVMTDFEQAAIKAFLKLKFLDAIILMY